MTSLKTEMRHVNYGGRIVGQHLQGIAGIQALKSFAGLQNGQGAEQPGGIKFGGVFVIHVAQIGVIFHSVHNVVTIRRGDVRQLIR